MRKGSRILVKTLAECGVDTVFGYPGSYVLDVYDELYASSGKIRHFETCHEQHACHAADGFSRAAGRAGVVLATSGPGATNLVTGIACAYMDSVPLVAITGNVPLAILGKDNFQEVDITGITMPVTKHNFIVHDVSELEETVVRAFEIAESGRKGPVLIDLPHDVLTGRADVRGLKKAVLPSPCAADEQVRFAAQLLSAAKRPLLLAGGGVSGEALKAFVSATGLPVCHTMAACAAAGGLSTRVGMVGLWGDARANRAVSECDLLLAVGTRFSDRVTNALPGIGRRAVIHVDLDRAELGKNVPPALAVCGDAGDFLARLVRELGGFRAPNRTKSAETEQGWDGEFPQALAEALESLRGLGEQINLATDVGFHQVFAAKNFPFLPGDKFVSSCGLGAMGFGLGGAMGAYLANGRPTALITGDGSFRMNLAELVTVARYRLPLTVVVCNNRSLGMVRRLQEIRFGGRIFETDGVETDFAAVARGFGIPAERTDDPARLAELLASRRGADSPLVIDFLTGRLS